jgi:hypothetical protein
MKNATVTVPVGPSTYAALATTVLAYGTALYAALHGDSRPETLEAVGTGTVALVGLIVSRTTQAIAHLRHRPADVPTVPVHVQISASTLDQTPPA